MRTIPGYPNYAATRTGHIYSKPRILSDGRRWAGRWLKFSPRKSGYIYVGICEKIHGIFLYRTRPLHQLVLEAYVGPKPSQMCCRHLDGNPSNNKLSNLSWGTYSENWEDRKKHGNGTGPRGILSGHAKLTPLKVRRIVRLYETGEYSMKKLALYFGVCPMSICRIINKKTWKHLWWEN